ncbi:DUF222 domain-containing protein [Geodermatophilus sp. SYSU D00691]
MATVAAAPPREGVVIDMVWRPHGNPLRRLSKQAASLRLQDLQRQRARLAAEEAEFILHLAALTPDDADPVPGTPGARSERWRRRSDPALPGVSESFPHELAHTLGVGHGTALHRARRAFSWRDSLPAVFAALAAGELDERRGQIFADVLAFTDPALARRVEAIVLPEAGELSFTGLEKRIRGVLLELDPDSADENRKLAEESADVFLEPGPDGRATLGAELPADEAAEGWNFLDTVAGMAKADGDARPIGLIRNEIYSLLLRGAALPGAAGARACLMVTAALESLEGTSSRPADVNGHAITPAQLRDLLRRIGALGLTTPDGGEMAFAITDADGVLVATLTLGELQRKVRAGEGADLPPDTDAYRATAAQRRFLGTRDRGCRHPFCRRRAGWADHDHVVPHAQGGRTTCTNLCCLCRTHHRLKTLFKGWLFAMEPDGTLHVISPAGITRTTRPWLHRRRPPPEPAEPDDDPPF